MYVATVRTRLVMLTRELLTSLSNFHLLHYRAVDGFLITSRNSGTHWLRFMLSHAMAHHYGLPPPLHSSGKGSEDFIGHARWARKHAEAPRIGASHSICSAVFGWAWVRMLLRLPPIVVLVRDPMDALLSAYVKWKAVCGLSLHRYAFQPPSLHRAVPDAWWYVSFFNRWGAIAKKAPDQVLVVRYEDLRAEPEATLARIAAHYGLPLTREDIEAGLEVASREAVRARLDSAHGEAIVPDEAHRRSVAFDAADRARLRGLFAEHLRHDFGYGYERPTGRAAARALAAPRLLLACTALYTAFSLFGRPILHCDLPLPWARLELVADFAGLTMLASLAAPRLGLASSSYLILSAVGVELLQASPLIPGDGSWADLSAEVAGIGVPHLALLTGLSAMSRFKVLWGR